MLASLPMYAMDATALNAFWTALAATLRARGLPDVPEALSVPADLESHWRQPNLLLSQTCGYPLVTMLAGDVRVVGAFSYHAPGCEGTRYRSLLIARHDDAGSQLAHFAGRRAAFNGRNSQSGYNSFRALVAPLSQNGRFFSATVETGAHARSMRAVADGSADIAAIDCVSYAVISRGDRGLADALKIVGETASAPGLPLITRGGASDADLTALRDVLTEVSADPALGGLRDRLMIGGFTSLDVGDYVEILAMERAAIALGYPALN